MESVVAEKSVQLCEEEAEVSRLLLLVPDTRRVELLRGWSEAANGSPPKKSSEMLPKQTFGGSTCDNVE